MAGGDIIHRVLAYWGNQIGCTLLAPESTLSFPALAATLGFAACAILAARRRPTRIRVLLRALFPRRLTRTASGRADIGWFLFSLLLSSAAIGWALFSADAVARLVSGSLGPAREAILPGWAAGAILTLAIWLAYEFAYWLDHMLCHKIPLLWEFHKIHHSAESLSLLTNFRVHPIDTIKFYNLTAIAMGATGALAGHLLGIGAPPFAIGQTNLLIYLSAIGITHLQHTHIWLRFGERGGRWLMGPAHHQIHHSLDPRHHDRNFGATLALWDRLFGTFHMPAARREVPAFGVAGLGYDPHGVARGLVMPVADAGALLVRGMGLPAPLPTDSGAPTPG